MTSNPFEITKAVDFTDAQIAANWVDLPSGGFDQVANPRSPMPRFLVGGKGGGRTHLLRYFSHSLQGLRHNDDLLAAIRTEGYVGVYFRCGGLNSSRFSGKDQPQSTWDAVFAYYTEVWLARLVITLLQEIDATHPGAFESMSLRQFVEAVEDLFDASLPAEESDEKGLETLAHDLRQVQRSLDIAINNCALTHRLEVGIGASPGRLVFGVPAAAQRHLASVADVSFAYLVDEFENLTVPQQRYVNTLIREKELPCTFLVGSRRFGVRTQSTLSAGEENKQGSEYDLVVLEDAYQTDAKMYPAFCAGIVRSRLRQAGIEQSTGTRLDDYFAEGGEGRSLEARAAAHTRAKSVADLSERPWGRRLETQLMDIYPKSDVALALERLSVPDSPLHEKFGLLLFYRAWADREELSSAAARVAMEVEALLGGTPSKKLQTAYKHYRHDLYAQLLEQLKLPQEYFGLQSFVRMSGYLPRNLLVVLKQVTRWSSFLGEEPFRGQEISARAQREGVREASSWFLSDAKGLGQVGEEAHLAIRRLGSLFREMRFTDKPVEVSCSAFTTDRRGVSERALKAIDEAVSHSLILERPSGRRDKNSRVLNHKYQLNPMLAPRFDLSLASRGSVDLSSEDVDAIFDGSAHTVVFEGVRRRIVERMQAPFSKGPSVQSSLLDG